MSYFKFASLYSAAIPLGVVIGAAIERAPGTAGDVISAILQGLAAGTFLHVTFQEFIPSEFSNR
ncbi:Zinc transporter ZIP3, partial [Stegodyphus mimosarum]